MIRFSARMNKYSDIMAGTHDVAVFIFLRYVPDSVMEFPFLQKILQFQWLRLSPGKCRP